MQIYLNNNGLVTCMVNGELWSFGKDGHCYKWGEVLDIIEGGFWVVDVE